MSDRVCLRGCTQRGVHYAECAWNGINDADIPDLLLLPLTPPLCRGCAPEKAKHGVMVCPRCAARFRRLLDDAPDLVGRLRSLADPAKAVEIASTRSGSRSVEAPAPVPADLIDAAEAVMRTLRTWAVYVDPRSGVLGGMPAGAGSLGAYMYARDCVDVILPELDRILNNRDDVLLLSEHVLTPHPADDAGEREAWSIVDAVSRYRLERPDDTQPAPVDDSADGELATFPIAEWGDKPVLRRDAAAHAGVGESTLRRWVKDKDLVPRVSGGPAGRVEWFRASDIAAAKKTVGERVGRSKKTPELENRSQ